VGVLVARDRLGRVFAGFVVANAVLIGVLGWQAVESQEVKGSLQGGLDGGTISHQQEDVGQAFPVSIPAYYNRGDRAITMEALELIEPTPGGEVVGVRGNSFVGDTDDDSFEGLEIRPGERLLLEIDVVLTQAGEPLGWRGLRVQYRAGGRAGQTVDPGTVILEAPFSERIEPVAP
jgi:hypothetical protein